MGWGREMGFGGLSSNVCLRSRVVVFCCVIETTFQGGRWSRVLVKVPVCQGYMLLVVDEIGKIVNGGGAVRRFEALTRRPW